VIDDVSWETIHADTYWGQWATDFALRGEFQVPEDWAPEAPVALYLPLGDAGEFNHPEALAFIDGVPYASCDRYHQEILLPVQWRDGQTHRLVLHGWTGFVGLKRPRSGTRLLMGGCAVVQIDQLTRDFVATARAALGIATSVDPDEPARGHLLNALDEAFKLLDIRMPPGERLYESLERAILS
jgi:alpha-mannosidase